MLEANFLNLTIKNILNKTALNWFQKRVGFLVKGKFTLREKKLTFLFSWQGKQ